MQAEGYRVVVDSTIGWDSDRTGVESAIEAEGGDRVAWKWLVVGSLAEVEDEDLAA
jgi:hypothetical protein